MSENAVTPQPDTPQPSDQGQDPVDLDPQIEPEPREEDDEADAAAGSDPAAGNSLINPENS